MYTVVGYVKRLLDRSEDDKKFRAIGGYVKGSFEGGGNGKAVYCYWVNQRNREINSYLYYC